MSSPDTPDSSGQSDGFESRAWRWFENGIAVAIAVAIVVPLCRRSINLSDEGYILLQSLDMLQGKVLYRDMDAFVSPGIWFLLSALFRILEPSVLASRLLCFGAYLATLVAAYRIVARLTERAWGLACVGLFLVFVVWAFPVWTWTFYSPFAVLFCLIGLDRLLIWRIRAERRDLIWIGVAFGLAILFKQNYGLFGLIGALAGMAAILRERAQADDGLAAQGLRTLAYVGLGGVAVALPMLSYFLYHGAVAELFQSLVVHPFVFAGQHSVAYLGLGALFEPEILGGVDRLTYGANSLYNNAVPLEWLRQSRLFERLHVLLYLLPPMIFAGALLLSFLPRLRAARSPRSGIDTGIFSLLAVSGMLFLGVFPRADYNHLINLYQPVLIVGTVVLHHTLRAIPKRRKGLSRVLVLATALLLSTYTAVAVYWYHEIFYNMNTLIGVKRGGVLVRDAKAGKINTLIEVIWSNSDDGDSLLSVPDLSMINFLAERAMPSPYYNLYQHHIAHDGGAAVVAGSQESDVKVALTNYSDFFSDRDRLRNYAPVLVDYLDRFFDIESTLSGDNYVFLTKRELPRPKRDVIKLLEVCSLTPEVEGVDWRVGTHLLFSTLYQDLGAHHNRDDWQVDTQCRIALPERAVELRMNLGLRPPLDAARGAFLVTEIFAQAITVPETSDTQERLFVTRIGVFNPFGLQLVRRWPRELRIDVSHLAGREVVFTFRSHRRGWVKRDPFSFKGYSTMWFEPRIYLRAE